MDVQFPLSRQDFRAYYNWIFRDQKAKQRRQYYTQVWSVVALCLFACTYFVKHKEWAPLGLFGWIAISHPWRNRSFLRYWDAAADAYAALHPECKYRLAVDDQGITSSFRDIQLRVPWAEVCSYAVHENRVFINYLEQRAFIVPLNCLLADERDDLMESLVTHRIPEASAGRPAECAGKS